MSSAAGFDCIRLMQLSHRMQLIFQKLQQNWQSLTLMSKKTNSEQKTIGTK